MMPLMHRGGAPASVIAESGTESGVATHPSPHDPANNRANDRLNYRLSDRLNDPPAVPPQLMSPTSGKSDRFDDSDIPDAPPTALRQRYLQASWSYVYWCLGMLI